jgi:hypothetical protein
MAFAVIVSKRVHPAASAEQPEPTAENVQKCADEKKATAMKQLLYFDEGATCQQSL